MVSPSLIVTDLDGTLWRTDDVVDARAVAALRHVADQGPPLLIATGRRVTSTRAPLARIGVAPPAIVLNGALGLDLASNARFHRMPFAAADAAAVLDGFVSAGLDPCIYVDDPQVEVLVSTTPSTNPGHLGDLGSSAGVADLAAAVWTATVLAFSIIGAPLDDLEELPGILGHLAEVHIDRSLDYPGTASVTIAPLGQSKWDGVTAFCVAHGLDDTRVVALGDGPNDVELLTRASLSLVPEDAHPAALELADRVIPSAAEGGWSAVLELL
jgi:hydroxymethylpyrimidine pyrophosphatase-like HAD family hydrolase